MIGKFGKCQKTGKTAVLFSEKEGRNVLSSSGGVCWLITDILYAAGKRIMECLRLPIRDPDFEYKQIMVRDGKGKIDRLATLAGILVEPLRRQAERVRNQHKVDLDDGYGSVYCISWNARSPVPVSPPLQTDKNRAKVSLTSFSGNLAQFAKSDIGARLPSLLSWLDSKPHWHLSTQFRLFLAFSARP